MKILFAHLAGVMAAIILSFAMVGCSVLERAGDYFSENPLVASLVVRQSVVRYIDAGASPMETLQRKDAAIDVLTKTLNYLDGEPRAHVDAIVSVLMSHIDFDSISAADRILIVDIIKFVQHSLEAQQAENQLPHDTVIALRSLLITAISAAESY